MNKNPKNTGSNNPHQISNGVGEADAPEIKDHKQLGRELDLFVFSELVGSGLPLWTPRGTLVRNLLDDFVWELRQKRGYEKVEIPHVTKKALYETSGHWEKFKDDLFHVKTREGDEFALKPMNCPHHTQIYARKPWSYRELPQRYANTTMCYRDEQSGELNGLSRTRAFTQDDAHAFCRETQVKEEFIKVWDIIREFYAVFGFEPKKIRLSFHDPKHPEKYLGDESRWKIAENILAGIAKEKGVETIDGVGEAAFYGPKLDFIALDTLGREWQVATIQLDMNMPERFDLNCINEKGEKERIVMIHAAIMGSIERFMSIILEHLNGAFPLWLSPVQAKVIPVSVSQAGYAREVFEQLRDNAVRAELDDSNETLGKRIRNAKVEKANYILVVGDEEIKSQTATLEGRTGKIGALAVEEIIRKLKEEISSRAL
ncbi:MAG TPA: threonine--tRNA ligase [Candidatus Paceibacterota bacterium]|nr:threonine--tRNA ligase [Candidatus Paceibacterota bacterium]